MAIEGGRVRWVFEIDDSQFDSALDQIEDKVGQAVKAINKAEKGGDSDAFSTLKASAQSTSDSLEQMEKAAKNIRFTTLSSGASLASSALSSLSSASSGVSTYLADTQTALSDLSDSFARSADAIAVSSKYISGENLTSSGLANAFTNAQTKVEDFGESVQRVASQPIEFIADTGGIEESLKSISSSLDNVKNKATETATSLGQLGTSLAKSTFSAFSTMAGSATITLTGLARKGIEGADSLETTRLSMAGLTGALSEGNKAMAIAAEFWQNNPFQRFDVSTATQQLVQFGRSTNDLKSDLKILGDVSLSTGVNIGELARYYARVSASGRAMTMDLEMMSDRGVPIYRELAKELKTTQAGVREFASAGKIDFETFRKAMENAVDSDAMAEYENTLARQQDRLSGSISMLAGDLAGYKVVNNELIISEQGLEKAWTRLIKTIATGLRSDAMREGLTKLGVALAQLVDKIIPYVEKGLQGLAKVIDFVGNNSQLIIPILGGAAVMMGRLATNIPILSDGLKSIMSGFNGMSSVVKTFISQHKGLSLIVAAVGVALIQAYRSSEEFRGAVSNLLKALGRLASSLAPIITTLANALSNFLQSELVTQVLIGVTNALASLADLLASFPQEQLVGIITFIGMFALLKTHPIIGVATAIGTIVSILKRLHESGVGVEEFVNAVRKNFTNLLDWLGKVPHTLLTIGSNIMVGLFNGLVSGGQRVIDYCADVARGIIQIFQSILEIHSPSRVFYRMGKYITLGLANGITSSKSAVQKAMDSLASTTLDKAKKVIQNKYQFGVIDYAGEYRQWKKVAKLFTKGSEQYNAAIENMEEARKNANLQIIELVNEYNDALDSNIKKTKQMLGLFSKVDASTAGMNAAQILRNLDKQVSRYEQWYSAQERITTLGFSDELVQELQDMGVEYADELASIANMTESELQTFQDLWNQKNLLGKKGGELISKDEQKAAIDSIKKITDGIDGETVNVKEAGARLTYSLSDGITGALPTLKDAYKEWDKYLAAAKKSLAKSGSKKTASTSGADLSVPSLGNNNALTKDLDLGLKDAQSSFQVSAEQMTQNLISVLGKVVLAVAAWQFGPKLLKALGSTSLGGKIAGFFGGLFGKGSAVEKAAEAATQSEQVATNTTKIAENTQTLGNGVQTVSKGVKKAQDFRKIIQEGCIAVGEIAVALVVMAAAVRLSYELVKDVDWAGFGKTMGMIAISVLEMGTLAAALGFVNQIGIDIKTGLILTAGIAGDMLLLAIALGTLDKAMTSDFGTMVGKIAAMGLAVLEIGGLATALGVLMAIPGMALVLAGGLITLAGIAADMIILANALQEVDQKVPDSVGRVKHKIDIIVDAVEYITSKNIGNFFQNVISRINLIGIPGLVSAYAQIGRDLEQIQAINIDPESVKAKVEVIHDVVEKIAGNDIVKSWVSMVSTFFDAIKDMEVAIIVNTYANIASKLKEIQDIPLNKKSIIDKVNLIKDVVETVGASGEDSIMVHIRSAVNTFLDLIKTFTVSAIVDVYHGMATKLSEIQNISLNEKKIKAKIELFGRVVDTISAPATSKGFFHQLHDTVNTVLQLGITAASDSILHTFQDMISPLNDIQNLDVDEQQVNAKLDQMGRVVKKISSMKGHGGAFALLADFYTGAPLSPEQAQGILDIMRRLSDIANTVNYMPSVDAGEAEGKIDSLTGVIAKLDSIKIGQDVSNQNWAWGELSSLINRVTEVIKTLNKIPKVSNKTKEIESVINAVNALLEVNTEVSNVDQKANIVDKASTIASKMVDLATSVNKLKSVDKDHLKAIQNLRNIVWEITQINEDVGSIEDKVNIVDSATKISEAFVKLKKSLDKLGKKVDYTAVIESYRDAVWNITRINEDVGDIHAKEEIVSIATSISKKFQELQKVYSKLKAVDVSVISSFKNAVDEALNIKEDYGDTHKKEENVSIATSIAWKLNEFYKAVKDLKDAKKAGSVVSALLKAVDKCLSGVQTSVKDNLDKFTRIGESIASNLKKGIENKKGDLENAGHAAQTAVWSAIEKRLPDMEKQGQTIARKVATGVGSKDAVSTVKTAGSKIVSSFLSAIDSKDNKTKAEGSGKSIANNLVKGLKVHNGNGISHGNYAAGANAVQGFINGAKSKNVYNVGWQIASSYLKGLKDRGEQGSPWKTTFESGAWAVEGLINGIRSQESALVHEATRVADNVVGALSAEDAIISPTLQAGVGFANTPRLQVAQAEVPTQTTASGTVINQYNNMYSDYDKDKIINDLSWALATR